MGCAASATDRAEQQHQRRRRGRGVGHGGEAGRRRRCKVAPDPKEEDDSAASLAMMPGSPSFRFYCQKSAAVDALVADADCGGSGSGDGEGSVRIRDTPQAAKNNGGLAMHDSDEFSKAEASSRRWLRFRGLAIVAAAVCSLFTRHSSCSTASAPSHPPPPAAKSQHRSDAARSAHP